MVTFAELIEEVGVDATRFLMLSRSSDQPIDFDIEVAKKKDNSNPCLLYTSSFSSMTLSREQRA